MFQLLSQVYKLFLFLLVMLVVLSLQPEVQAAGIYTGTVYHDYNSNNVMDTGLTVPASGSGSYAAAIDTGVGGITVTLFDGAGNSVTTLTDANGNYTLNSGTLGPGPYRLEFSGYEALFYHTGPARQEADPDSTTSVKFVDDGGGTYNFPVERGDAHCENNPLIATSCFVYGDRTGINSNRSVFVSFPYGAGSTRQTGNTIPPDIPTPTAHSINIPHNQLGSTFGGVYDPVDGQLYVGTYTKRHSGFGPGGIGMIYQITPVGGVATTATPFFDMNTLTGNPAGIDFRAPAGHDYDRDGDNAGWDAVGKTGLGGLAIDRAGEFLYVMALGNRTLYRLPVNEPPVEGVNIISQPVPLSGCAAAIDVRPFAVTYVVHQNVPRLYVGVICSGESSVPANPPPYGATGNSGLLRALVYQVDPATLAFGAPVVNIPLNYPRGQINGVGTPAEWLAWAPQYRRLNAASGNDVYPQPMLTQIAFDRGNMILGLRDRLGDQVGNFTLSEPGAAGRRRAIVGGDTLRMCGGFTTGWTLENAGLCPDGSGSGAVYLPRPQGPGDGEYYAGDEYHPYFADPTASRPPGVSGLDFHDEVSLGGVAQLAGFPDLAVTMFDPAYIDAGGTGFNSGGIRWFNNQAGLVNRSYQIYAATTGNPAPLFGKANGLGGLVTMCERAQLEIGNRVWLDTNRNGIQDANETPFDGVTVSLWEDTNGDGFGDIFIVNTTTAGGGQYYFVENGRSNNAPGTAELPAGYNNGTGQWRYGRDYVVQLDNANDYLTGALQNLFITLQDSSLDLRDSDGIATPGTAATPVPPGFLSLDGITFARRPFNVGFPGQNNHTYDFGFNDRPPVVVPPPGTTTGADQVGSAPALSQPEIAQIPRLPATGESPRQNTRYYLLALTVSLIAVLWLLRRSRKSA